MISALPDDKYAIKAKNSECASHFFSLRQNIICVGTIPFSKPLKVNSGVMDICVVYSYRCASTEAESI